MNNRIQRHRVGNSSSKYDFDNGASLDADIAEKFERQRKNVEAIERAIRSTRATPEEARSYILNALEALYGIDEFEKINKTTEKMEAENADLRARLEAIKAENSKLSLEAATAKSWQKKYVSTKLALEMAEKRADAAVEMIPHDCDHCKHHGKVRGICALLPDGDEFSADYTEGFNRDDCEHWEWRGNHGTEGEQ